MFEKGMQKCVVVAELSCNHSQSFEKAVRLVLAAKWAGADAVKVQMFQPEEMTINSRDKSFVIGEGIWAGKSLYELYQAAYTPYEWIPKLKDIAEELGLFFFTSVYHPDTVAVCEEMNIPAYKISSFEIGYEELVRKVAKTGKPVIISTGQAEIMEILTAKKWVESSHRNVWFLHCISKYPALAQDMNLRTLYDLSRYCSGKIGLSDHSIGSTAAILSISMGARIIEKHLKLDDNCLDAEFSMMPQDFRLLVNSVKDADLCQGVIKYGGKKRFYRTNIDGKMVRVVNNENS
jgi:pseudaminic acid synthase